MARDPATMLTEAVRALLLRDLRALQRELDAYPDDEHLWKLAPGIANSAGTLALHIAGNLRHFLGAVLGGSGYVRDRDAEFSRRDLDRDELRREIEAAMRTVETTLSTLTREQLDASYPVPLAGRRVRTSDFLVHLVSHLDYHLGQIDYHRRLLTSGGTVETISPAGLPAVED